MGLKEGAVRDGVRNVSTGVVAVIPDSALSHDYNALQESTGTLSAWTDRAGSEDLTGTAPMVVSDGINGHKSVRYDDVDDVLTAQTASEWAFLHDGSPFTVYLVAEAFGSGEYQSFILTQSFFASSQNIGFALARDDAANTNALRVFIAIGNDGAPVINSVSGGAFPPSSPEIFVVRFDGVDQYTIDRGKTTLDSPTATNHTTANPDQALLVGDDVNPLNSDVGRELFYTAEHSDSTRDTVVEALANDFGITL